MENRGDMFLSHVEIGDSNPSIIGKRSYSTSISVEVLEKMCDLPSTIRINVGVYIG
jgi:hypothetical protein